MPPFGEGTDIIDKFILDCRIVKPKIGLVLYSLDKVGNGFIFSTQFTFSYRDI